jgi:hypothetical protein
MSSVFSPNRKNDSSLTTYGYSGLRQVHALRLQSLPKKSVRSTSRAAHDEQRSTLLSATTHSCTLCGCQQKTPLSPDGYCSKCTELAATVREKPKLIRTLWQNFHDEPILPRGTTHTITSEAELPEVLDGKRYRAIDRDQNKWYLSISELEGKPVEIFASTAFDRDHELQSRISNLTTITRLISLLLRHLFMGEPLTFDKCLKQIQRSSRQKNDLPDMLYGVLNKYQAPNENKDHLNP